MFGVIYMLFSQVARCLALYTGSLEYGVIYRVVKQGDPIFGVQYIGMLFSEVAWCTTL